MPECACLVRSYGDLASLMDGMDFGLDLPDGDGDGAHEDGADAGGIAAADDDIDDPCAIPSRELTSEPLRFGISECSNCKAWYEKRASLWHSVIVGIVGGLWPRE